MDLGIDMTWVFVCPVTQTMLDMDPAIDLDMDMIWVFVCLVTQTIFEELTSFKHVPFPTKTGFTWKL